MDEKTEDSDKVSAAAAARRDARIKRILGNSKNRLNKIAGKEEEEETANGKRKIVLICQS